MGFADEKMIKSNGDENPPEQGNTPQQVGPESSECPGNLLCTEEEVLDIIASLDISKATG